MANRVRVTDSRVPFDAASLARAVDGRIVSFSRASIHGGAVDSRRVESGNIFFALPGEHTDGHRFLRHAAERGAGALIVTQPVDAETLAAIAGLGKERAPTIIQVEDGLAALHDAARAWWKRFDPVAIGVTGSLAKTSTKEQIAEVMSERWNVLRNTANENNEIGVPLTMLRYKQGIDMVVLEMGMYQPGDVAELAALAKPVIGVVTAVRGTHLERAGSIDEIERGKRELVESLPPKGAAILNADDPRVARMVEFTGPGVRVFTYGFSPNADVRATDVESLGSQGMRFRLHGKGSEIEVTTPALGRHGVHNALAAAAVGIAASMSLEMVARGLARPFSVPHRSTLIDMGPITVLDDSYNAAPDSMIAALDLLASLPGRHIAILGEMLELGAVASAEHERVGEHAGRLTDVVVATGPWSESYQTGARRGTAVVWTTDRDSALDRLDLRAGDVVLIKGSRGAEMERLIPALEKAAHEIAEPVV